MTFLLDVNVLLVLHDPLHPHYQTVFAWFQQRGKTAFATCPITQSGFVRFLTRGVPGMAAFELTEAREALQNLTRMPGHIYWPDTPDFLSATRNLATRMQGYRQITDAYLLGLAIHRRGKLATVDAGIRHLAGSEFAANVEIIERQAFRRPSKR